MEQLQYAIKSGATPELTINDNLRAMALIEAAYRRWTRIGQSGRKSFFPTLEH